MGTSQPVRSPSAEAARWLWNGPDCNMREPLERGEADADRARVLVCDDWSGFGQSVDLGFDLSDRNARLDDRKPDALLQSVIVLTCARFCDQQNDMYSVGLAAELAETIDDAALTRAVGALAWPNEQKTFYVARVHDAAKLLADRAAALDPRVRAIAVELPRKLHAERARYYRDHAKQYAALDAIRPTRDAAELHALEDVRVSYFTTCASPDCRFDPLPIEATKRIVQVALATHDTVRTAAEGSLFSEHGALRNTYGPMLYRTVFVPARALENQAKDYEQARRDGADRDTLAARFGGGPPPEVYAGQVWRADDEAPNLLRGLDQEGLTSTGGIVAAIVPHGALSEIRFEDNVITYDQEDCVETDKVDRITSDGRIEYRQNCRVVGTHVERRPTSPVRVPAADARALRAKDNVAVIVGADRTGLVISVHDKRDALVQFRGIRFQPEAAYHAIAPEADVDHAKVAKR
ncbi:MAG TPA: hypothetical protein VMJ10_20000 [Kofleriaceae bacterium]|nr:hypothetical protein [Kofleriaceae bacterium]